MSRPSRSPLALALAGLLLAPACGPGPRPPCDPDPPPGVLGSICGFDRPEDFLVLPRAGVVITSGMRAGAGLYAVALEELGGPDPRPWRIWPARDGSDERGAVSDLAGDPACTEPPPADVFYSHGLGDRPPQEPGPVRIAVVNHGGRESVELFDVEGRGRDAALRWRGCVELPEGLLGNDVDVAPDGEIVVTNMAPRHGGIALRLTLLAASVGVETGEVIAWSRDRGWRRVPGSRGAGPNGIVLSPDGRLVYFADNGHHRVTRLPRAGLPEGAAPDAADLGANVDNVTWTPDGRILAIAHTGGVEAVLQECLMDWALFEIDPATLEARELFRHDGRVLCGATSAQRIGGRYYIGSMNEERIGVWRPEGRSAP